MKNNAGDSFRYEKRTKSNFCDRCIERFDRIAYSKQRKLTEHVVKTVKSILRKTF